MKLFDKLFGSEKKLGDIVQKFVPILIYSVDSFVLDKCNGDVEISATAKEPFDIVKEKLKVNKHFKIYLILTGD